MSKKVQKTLTGAMAAMMATGVVATPAMAATNNTDVDALYKAAYQATQKALTEKTQAAVNEARAAIKALPAKLDWAIGEFSKQVDTIQHPILVNIVNAIKTAEKTPTQANINAAKKAIPAELTEQWKNSYSSAVDKIQAGLQEKAVKAYKDALENKTQENVDAAKKIFEELLTADSQGIKDWAATMMDKVESIEVYALKITGINEITRNTITVYHDAVAESLKNVTIEVIDGNGKVQEVVAKNLFKGSKKTVFEFKNILGATSLKGIWKINGVEYNFEEASLIKSLKDNVNAENLVALQDAGYISGLLGQYNSKNVFVFDKVIAANGSQKGSEEYYIEAITPKKSTILTSADVQDIIDSVNASLEGNEISVSSLIELANSTKTTNKQLLEAMNSVGLEAVNEDWIKKSSEKDTDKYKEEIAKITTNKLADVQAKIYDVNKRELEKINTNISQNMSDTEIKVLVSTIENKIELVEEYHKADSGKITTKNDLLKELNIKLAVLDVKAASDEITLSEALNKLSEVVNKADTFSYAKNVNEFNMKNYLNVVKTATSAEEVRDAIVNENANLARTEIQSLAQKETADDLLEALKSDILGLNNIKDANKDAYLTNKAIIAGDLSRVQNSVDAINALVEMQDATSKEEMRSNMVTFISKMGISDYKALSNAQLDDIAEELYASFSENEDIIKNYSKAAAAITFANIARQNNIGSVNNSDVTEVEKGLKAISGKSSFNVGVVGDFMAKNTGKNLTSYSQVRAILKTLGVL